MQFFQRKSNSAIAYFISLRVLSSYYVMVNAAMVSVKIPDQFCSFITPFGASVICAAQLFEYLRAANSIHSALL